MLQTLFDIAMVGAGAAGCAASEIVAAEAQAWGQHEVKFFRNDGISSFIKVSLETGASIKYVTQNRCLAGTA